MKQDRNFDDLGDRFAQNIYGSPKGKIRQAVLWQQLTEQIPPLVNTDKLRVLDAGCGMGQLAARLVKLGHQLTLCDVSNEMLEAAQQLIGQESCLGQGASNQSPAVSYNHLSLQSVAEAVTEPFAVVLCHAVLEWLDDAEAAIKSLAQLVAPNNYLSLTFYNRDALIYRNLINGNLRKVKSGDYAGHPGGLTPGNPLDPGVVFSWLDANAFDVQFKAGVRVFYDYIPRAVREKLSLEDVLELEHQFGQMQPYSMLARYIHVVARRRPVQ